jgi:hypothetical protein
MVHQHGTGTAHDADEHTHAEAQEQMCCDGSGRTAEQHRAESEDGKCCVDK